MIVYTFPVLKAKNYKRVLTTRYKRLTMRVQGLTSSELEKLRCTPTKRIDTSNFLHTDIKTTILVFLISANIRLFFIAN